LRRLGGWFRREQAEDSPVRIRGCTWGGSALFSNGGMIAAPGMCIEFDNGVRTTRAREVRLIRGGRTQPALNERVGRDALSGVTRAFNRGGRGEELGFSRNPYEMPPRQALPKKENRSSPRPPRLKALDLRWNARVGRDALSGVTRALTVEDVEKS
jgi:hypothetical protein